jgi:hypothetical protein
MNLTDTDKKLIINALMYVYDKKIDLLKRDHKVMAEKEIDWTLANANRYFDMIDKIKKVKK